MTLYCPRVFDGWACWNDTPAGENAYVPCPSFIEGFSPHSELGIVPRPYVTVKIDTFIRTGVQSVYARRRMVPTSGNQPNLVQLHYLRRSGGSGGESDARFLAPNKRATVEGRVLAVEAFKFARVLYCRQSGFRFRLHIDHGCHCGAVRGNTYVVCAFWRQKRALDIRLISI